MASFNWSSTNNVPTEMPLTLSSVMLVEPFVYPDTMLCAVAAYSPMTGVPNSTGVCPLPVVLRIVTPIPEPRSVTPLGITNVPVMLFVPAGNTTTLFDGQAFKADWICAIVAPALTLVNTTRLVGTPPGMPTLPCQVIIRLAGTISQKAD